MLEIFTALTGWLEMLLEQLSGNIWLALLFIFLIAATEAVFILGLFIPSTPVLLLAGGLIADGRLPFWEIYLVAVLGAVVGDAISYTVGYWLKDSIKTVWPFRNYLHLIDRGEAFFARHGGKSVFIGRFIPGVKAVVPGIAGMFGMDYRRFSIINVTSAFVWAAAHILPGMLLSAWLRSMGLSLEWVILIGAAVIVVLLLIAHNWHRLLRSGATH
ncbi:DedA family protein [Devosia sp. CN2-171]|uniref:DedA family protein n=1 Tax=Devosia sp. CN2-171 TaxID=3400909 RepID=UPI003BF84A3F